MHGHTARSNRQAALSKASNSRRRWQLVLSTAELIGCRQVQETPVSRRVVGYALLISLTIDCESRYSDQSYEESECGASVGCTLAIGETFLRQCCNIPQAGSAGTENSHSSIQVRKSSTQRSRTPKAPLPMSMPASPQSCMSQAAIAFSKLKRRSKSSRRSTTC